MILIVTWTIALVAGLCLCILAVLVRWLRVRPARRMGIGFDVAKLGTRMSRAQAVTRPPRVRGFAVSDSRRLERLLRARAYIVSLSYFADK